MSEAAAGKDSEGNDEALQHERNSSPITRLWEEALRPTTSDDEDAEFIHMTDQLSLPGAARSAGMGGARSRERVLPNQRSVAVPSESSLLAMGEAALDRAASLRRLHERLNASGELFDERRRKDLASLGENLYEYFSHWDANHAQEVNIEGAGAVAELDAADSRPQKRQTPQNQRERVPLRELGFPVSLCLLVTSLLDAQDDGTWHRYGTAEEVEEDLVRMTEFPDRYLIDVPLKGGGKILQNPSNIYGRSSEQKLLREAFDRVVGSTSNRELIFVSGPSGAGKTALVEHMSAHLATKNGRFVRGKFDEQRQALPLSIIFGAFDKYCQEVADEGGQMADFIRAAIRSDVGDSASVLTGLFPNLLRLTGAQSAPPEEVGGQEALNRFILIFKLLVKAISRPSHPVVLFLDDIQWADEQSLDLLIALLSSENLRSLLAICSYRDNEIGPNHPLLNISRKLSSRVNVLTIPVRPIDVESTTDMLADMLRIPPRLTVALSSLAQVRSGGNSLFTIQFIQSLVDDGLLYYSASKRMWEWDADSIQSKEIPENVVDLVTEKILKAPGTTQFLLKVAACLGQGFNDASVRMLGLLGSIDAVLKGGFMFKNGDMYRFAHDKVREASYALLTEEEKPPLHLLLGKSLWKSASESELDSILFTVVEQLQLGSSLVVDRNEKLAMARLCYSAGKKADALLAFLPASIYYLYGCGLLDESDWDSEYHLCHQLNTRCAQALFVTGSYDAIPRLLEPVLSRSRNIQDRLRPMCTLVSVYSAQDKLETLDIALPLLRELGEELPMEPTEEHLTAEFAKTRALAQTTSVETILLTPVNINQNKQSAMKILRLLTRFAYRSNPSFCSLISLRMVQLSLREGLCHETPYSMALFGITCIMNGIIDEDVYRYAKVALSLMDKIDLDRLDSMKEIPRVYASTSMVKVFFEPMQAIPEFLDHAHEVGMSRGDIGLALGARHVSFLISTLAGVKLGPLAEQARAFRRLLVEYKDATLGPASIPYQSILNILGHSNDPTVLSGFAIENQEEFFNSLVEKKQQGVLQYYYFFRMWLAFIFRRMDLAAQMANELGTLMKTLKPEILAHQTLFLGLVATEMVHAGGDAEWRLVALRSKERLDDWAKLCHWNFAHKSRLMAAEVTYKLDGDPRGGARVTYDEAISLASKHKFVHEEAVACELASLYCRDPGGGATQRRLTCTWSERGTATKPGAPAPRSTNSMGPSGLGGGCVYLMANY